jgi:hypothetical protein
MGILFREQRVFRGGRQVLGTSWISSVNGTFRDLFDWLLSELLSCVR